MNGKKGGEHDPKEENNYERATYLLRRREWNISYPINAGLLIFSAIAAAGIILQAIYLDQTLNETRADFKAAQRAYVNLGSRNGVLAEFDPKATTNGKPIVVIHFTNGGQSTARHLSIEAFTNKRSTFSFSHRHRFRGSMGDTFTVGGGGEGDLAAQAERTEYIFDASQLWTFDELKVTDTQKAFFEIHGEIAYCDIFGVFHCEPFSLWYNASIGKFSPAGKFPNCAIESGIAPAWDLGNGRKAQYKEIEPCEQPDEPEYYAPRK